MNTGMKQRICINFGTNSTGKYCKRGHNPANCAKDCPDADWLSYDLDQAQSGSFSIDEKGGGE